MFLGPVIPVCAARQGTQEYAVDIEAGTFGGTVPEDALYVSGGVREDESRAGSIGLMV